MAPAVLRSLSSGAAKLHNLETNSVAFQPLNHLASLNPSPLDSIQGAPPCLEANSTSKPDGDVTSLLAAHGWMGKSLSDPFCQLGLRSRLSSTPETEREGRGQHTFFHYEWPTSSWIWELLSARHCHGTQLGHRSWAW